MISERMTVSSNQLDIRNPRRVHGAVRLLMGGLLGVVVLGSPLVTDPGPYFESVEAAIPQLDPDANPEQTMAALAVLLPVAFLSLFVLLAILRSLTAIIQGCRRMMSFFVPTGGPGPITGRDSTIDRLLNERAIRTYDVPSPSMRLAGAMLSSRFRYVRGDARQLVEEFMRSIPMWFIVLAILSAPRFIPTDELPPELAEVIGTNWPLPMLLAAVVVVATLVRLIAVIASVPRAPEVEIFEQREHLDNTGNPLNFYNHMQTLLSQVRYRRFPNRVIRQSPPSVGRVSQGDGDSFASRIVIETQPEPVAEGVSINAVVLDVGGWSLVCAGYAILLYSVEPFGPLLPLLIDGLAAVMAITIGGRLLARGDRLHEVFRFESDIVAISLTGTYTVSGIGLGDGRGGQLYSQRSSLQSDTHVSVLGARLLTECSPIDGRSALEAPRAVLDSAADPEFERRIEHVLAGMREFEDTAGRLAGIDLSAPAVEQIVSANAQIQQAAASPQRLEGPPAMASLELLGHADEDADEWKVCPDCGETIREVARKCRFCDFRYGADEPEGVAVDGVECPEATSR